MNWKKIVLISLSAITVIGTLLFIIKVQYDSITRLKAIESSIIETKNLGEGIVRSQSSYATKKDLENIIEDQKINLDKIKKDLEVFGATVKGVNTVKVISSGYSGTNLPSTEAKPREDVAPAAVVKDTYGYLKSSQWLRLNEPFKDGTNVPLGNVGFSAWQKNPWTLNITPRTYSTTTVYGSDDEGRLYAYSKVTIDVEGKQYTLPITESKMVQQYPTAKFSFNPKLYLGAEVGAILNDPKFDNTYNLSMSLFSYGKSKVLPTWTFVNLGLGYSISTENPMLMVAPVNYNIAEHLPLVTNLYIGPSLSIDKDRNVGLYFGIRVGL